MKWAMYSVSSLALLTICNQALAADGNINITGNQNSIYIASDNVSGSSFDNLSITSSTATFKKDLIGNQNKNVTNQTLSFSGKTAEGNIIGLSRVRNGANITQKNTINISGGVIEGDVLATSDEGNYNGTERRSHNLVNISGGTFGGNIEGGAGADNNVITITGGTFKASNNNNTLSNDDGDDGDCGEQGIGTIYAGVSDPNTKNQSNNATVTLKNLNNTNSFITSFVEGNNNQSGIIFGSNITGMSQLQFNNVNATYNGGFKDFDYVDVDVTSQVALNGKSYYADIWKVSGTLNTNGKTIHSYKNSTLNLNVANTGNVTQQFISDANVDAINQGNINGISTNKNIALNNSGNMSGNYSGVTVNITNSGNINNSTDQSTSISSQNSGVLTNTGQIKESLTLNHGMSINNNTGGNIVNAQIKNEQNELNINNSGTIHASEFINQGNKTINITNNSNGVISKSLSLTNGTLNLDNNGGTLTDNQFSSNVGVFNINNSGTINGNTSLSASNGGSMSLANQVNGLVTGSLEIVSGLSNFENNGLFQDLNITNQQSGLTLTNNGQVSNVSFNNNDGNLDIQNSGEFSGITNFAGSDDSTITLSNTETGNISGQFVVNGGLASLENQGNISNWQLASNISAFTINNDGTLSGNNELVSEGEITFNNSAEVSGNLFLNSARTIINNNSADWDNNIIGTAGDGNLDFTNASDGTSITTLSGNFNDLSLQNNNTDITASQLSLDNSANINGQIELGNEGYMDFTNNSNLAADISDNLILADSDTNLVTRFDLTNNAQISGDISVINSALHLTNQTGAEITSNHIDTRELYLTNSGKFENTSDYTFSVQDYINFDNSGVINGGDMVLKLSGDDVRGQITNSGTMWSYGTTIGEENKLRLANNNQVSNELNLYNTGLVIAVDPTDFTIPRLDSYAINAPSMNVYNQNAGVIGGSMNVNNYTQESGTTWVTFMDKDKSVMSTITAQNEVTIEPGAVLFVNTNNDTTAFTDGQQFKLVTALGMEEDEIKTQLDNYILQTDTPFANYSMMNEGNDGYIVFNKVAPSNFASSTDLTTSNHNNIVAGAHRVYELFVNRNMKSSLPNGMSSGDEIEKHTHLAFMPVVGHARQKEDINHAGYRSDYHGGIGYIEHNFTPTIKGGLGVAYLQNNTDYTDDHGSYSNSDTYRPFAYINYTNDNWRFDVAAGTAKHKIRNNRKYSFNNNVYMAKSKYDSDEISAHVSAGYRFHLSDSFMLQPMAGLFAAHVKTDTYEETGNGPMNMHISSEDYTSFKSMLGLKIKKEYKLSESFRLKPEMHLRWYHELGDTNGAVSAYFLEQQELFNANGADAPRDIGDIALRLTTERNDNLDLFVEGFYQFGQDFYNLGGTIGIKYNF